MNKELLTKMNWLYNAGFEPDMCYSQHCADNLTQWLIYPAEDFCEDGMSSFIAWFSESALWSLLPEKINNCSKMILRTDVRYAQSLLVKPLHYEPYPDRSLHTALLDLAIWAIKEGYLKAETKSE